MLQKRYKLTLYFMILKPYFTIVPLVEKKSPASIPYSLILKQIGICYIKEHEVHTKGKSNVVIDFVFLLRVSAIRASSIALDLASVPAKAGIPKGKTSNRRLRVVARNDVMSVLCSL